MPDLKTSFRKAAEYFPCVDKALTGAIIVMMGIDFYNGDFGFTDYAFLAAWGAKGLIAAYNKSQQPAITPPALPKQAAPLLLPPPKPQG